eukprot:scaffold37642_cov30-Tisochrysis_lutea.AAC.2
MGKASERCWSPSNRATIVAAPIRVSAATVYKQRRTCLDEARSTEPWSRASAQRLEQLSLRGSDPGDKLAARWPYLLSRWAAFRHGARCVISIEDGIHVCRSALEFGPGEGLRKSGSLGSKPCGVLLRTTPWVGHAAGKRSRDGVRDPIFREPAHRAPCEPPLCCCNSATSIPLAVRPCRFLCTRDRR